MTPSDPISWSEIEAAAARVLDAPPDDRERVLRSVTGSRPELMREVRAILDADATCGDFLERARSIGRTIASPAARDGEAGPDAPPEVAIPGYTLVRSLGEGGMGSVHLARPESDPEGREVAIKLLRADLTDAETVRRFEREGRILASLTHHNVARHEGHGVAPDGRPYLVMEHVDGSPITEYADRHRLGVADRVRLLRDACRGVGHAHRNHVVHRDIKPSNVLVSTSAEAKVLDFGIARWVEGRAPEAYDATLTRTAQRVLTPRYASPEQIRGDVVGPPSDVFSLGILLYQLLTGRHPHATASWSVGETERAILDRDPPPPSEAVLSTADILRADGSSERIHPNPVALARGTRPDALSRELSGDLDRVVARALSRSVEGRHPDADALARDLDRVLAGEPLDRGGRAWRRPGTWIRRGRRRRRGPESTAVREVARQVRRADSMLSFLAVMFERVGPVGGDPDLKARDLLDWSAGHVDDALADEPDARVDLLTTFGRIYLDIGDPDAALGVLRRSIADRRRLYGERDHRLVETLQCLATAHQELAEFDAAESAFREALELTRETYGEDHLVVASRMNDLAILVERRGRPSRARALHEEALRIKRRHLPDDDVSVLSTLNNLGVLLQRMGHARQSQHLLRQVLAARRRRYGDDHVHVANALSNLMIAHRRLGDPVGAEPLAREVLALRVRLLGSEHPDVAVSRFNLASILRDTGRLDEAERLFRRAIDASARRRGEDHPDTEGHRSGLALLRHRQGRTEEAMSQLTSVCASMSESLGPRHPQLMNLRLELARMLVDVDRCDEALEIAEDVVRVRRDHYGDDAPLTAEAMAVRARSGLRTASGRDFRAELSRAMAVLADAWEPEHPELVRCREAWAAGDGTRVGRGGGAAAAHRSEGETGVDAPA